MREKLAELAHSQWSGWMRYLFSKCIPYKPGEIQNYEGALIIPKVSVDRWKRQTETPYSELSNKEQDSNREQADKFLKVINTRFEEVYGGKHGKLPKF